MNPASYRRERWWSTNYASSRELFWFSGVVFTPVCRLAARERSKNGYRNQTDFGLLYLPCHARAAVPPIGGSSFLLQNKIQQDSHSFISCIYTEFLERVRCVADSFD